MRRVLIVSPHFPPTNAPDHQRVRMSLPYFREFGWEPVVLAVKAEDVSAVSDPWLAAALPPNLAVHRVPAWPVRWSRFVGLGNVAYRAWTSLRRTGDQLLAGERFDLVYFSTTQFVATALGARWLAKYHVPFVVDLQDPWRTDYYERPDAPRPPGGWKYRVARWQATRLEERSWHPAAGFVSVTEDYLAQLRERYPWFAAKPAAVIPFGGAEADFAFAAARADLPAGFERQPGFVYLVGVGAIGAIMRDSIAQLCAGVRRLRELDPAMAARLRLVFLGTSYAPAHRAEPSVVPIAAKFDVADLVREETGRIGYFAALKTLLAADALVIPGSNESSYNPSKLANCFLAEKPVLALAPRGSPFERLAGEFRFTVPGHRPDVVSEIVAFLRTVLTAPASLLPDAADRSAVASSHSARTRTRQQCTLFERAISPHTPAP